MNEEPSWNSSSEARALSATVIFLRVCVRRGASLRKRGSRQFSVCWPKSDESKKIGGIKFIGLVGKLIRTPPY